MMERVSSMTAEEADQWFKDCKEHWEKQHPHLRYREYLWKTWPTEVARKAALRASKDML